MRCSFELQRVSVFVDRRDENLKVEGVQGQTQTRSERGEIGSEGLGSGMDWTYGEEQDVMGKVFIIVFGEREIEKDLRNLDKDDFYGNDKIVSWVMSVLWQNKRKRTTQSSFK